MNERTHRNDVQPKHPRTFGARKYPLWHTAHALCAVLIGVLTFAASFMVLFSFGCVGYAGNLGPCVGGTRLVVQNAVTWVALCASMGGNIHFSKHPPSRAGLLLLSVEAAALCVANPLGAVWFGF